MARRNEFAASFAGSAVTGAIPVPAFMLPAALSIGGSGTTPYMRELLAFLLMGTFALTTLAAIVLTGPVLLIRHVTRRWRGLRGVAAQLALAAWAGMGIAIVNGLFRGASIDLVRWAVATGFVAAALALTQLFAGRSVERCALSSN